MPSKSEYFVLVEEMALGPLTGSQLKRPFKAGELLDDDLVRKNQGSWVPVSRIRGLGERSPKPTAVTVEIVEAELADDPKPGSAQPLNSLLKELINSLFYVFAPESKQPIAVDGRESLESERRSIAAQFGTIVAVITDHCKSDLVPALSRTKQAALNSYQMQKQRLFSWLSAHHRVNTKLAPPPLPTFVGSGSTATYSKLGAVIGRLIGVDKKRKLVLAAAIPVLLVCVGLAGFYFYPSTLLHQAVSFSGLDRQTTAEQLTSNQEASRSANNFSDTDDPVLISGWNSTELADGESRNNETSLEANESTDKSRGTGPLVRWNINPQRRETEADSNQKEKIELAIAERDRQAESEYWARRNYLEQQNQIYRLRQYEAEQRMLESQEQAQHYYNQAQQAAEYETQHQMNEYRSQMSGRMGALGIQW